MSGNVVPFPTLPRLDAPCPGWCTDHRSDVIPIGAVFWPYVEHRGPIDLGVPGLEAWLSWDLTLNDQTGDVVTIGPAVWLRDGMNGNVAIPLTSLEVVAGALIDAASVLGQ